jgi:hypothetical protein
MSAKNGLRPEDIVALLNHCDVAWIMATSNTKAKKEKRKNLILTQAPTFPKFLVTLDIVELLRFENSFPAAVCQEPRSIP